MARKSNQGKILGRGKSKSLISESVLKNPIDLLKFNGGGYKKFLRDIYKNPIPLYLASGVGSYFLVRFLVRYYKDHPEIADFVRDNFETVESRLREFRGRDSMHDMAHH